MISVCRKPHHNLCVGGYGQGQQTGAIMQSIAPVLEQAKPALVLVVGDVRSTLGAALAAAELQIPIAHVEAGLRSGDRRMPEEINRIVTDTLSDYLFASEQSGVDNLRAEGVPDDRVFLVGNVMIDTLLRLRDRARESTILSRLDLAPKTYAVATLHRPSNVDDPEQLARLLEVLTAISERIPIVFPAHPRTLQRIESSQVSSRGIRLLPPARVYRFSAANCGITICSHRLWWSPGGDDDPWRTLLDASREYRAARDDSGRHKPPCGRQPGRDPSGGARSTERIGLGRWKATFLGRPRVFTDNGHPGRTALASPPADSI